MTKPASLAAVRHLELLASRVVDDVPSEAESLAAERRLEAMRAPPRISMALLHHHRASTHAQTKRAG